MFIFRAVLQHETVLNTSLKKRKQSVEVPVEVEKPKLWLFCLI